MWIYYVLQKTVCLCSLLDNLFDHVINNPDDLMNTDHSFSLVIHSPHVSGSKVGSPCVSEESLHDGTPIGVIILEV